MGCSTSNLQVDKSRKKPLGQPLAACFSDRPRLEMLHFNDVYNIEERAQSTSDRSKKIDPKQVVAGASRFVSAFDQRDSAKKLVLFSGDLFSPSHCKLIVFVADSNIVVVVSTHLQGE